ncbi:MAG: hypothetical protein JNN01_10335 [Opitutaceae bacterium]|nr:hypothetical protein [Opitutaceae bacterium]
MLSLLLGVVALPATLPALAEVDATAGQEQLQAAAGGAVELALRRRVTLTHATLQAAADGVWVRVDRSGGGVEAIPTALGWPESWSRQGLLRARVTADEAMTVELTVVLPRGRLAVQRMLAAGESAVLSVDLADMPLAAGTQALDTPMAVRWIARWAGDRPRTLHLAEVELVSREGERGPVVDRFGQRRNQTWPGKVREEADLRLRRDNEGRELATQIPPTDRDRFGGWTGGPVFASGRFFRVERDGRGKWWLVTPDGHPFFSMGATGVRVGFVMDTARAADRRELFEALPDRGAEGWFEGRWPTAMGEVDLPGNVHFYRWNVLRKYGSFQAWAERVLERFPRWGFNTIGSWSEEAVLRQDRVPHTRFLRARMEMPEVPSVRGFPDVWDPRWEAGVDAEFARETSLERDNPWLVGYFVDNEGGWSDLRLLDFPKSSALRRAWLEFVRSEFPTTESVSEAWGRVFANWDEVESLRSSDVPASGPAKDLVRRFETSYAARYAATVRRLLRKHDPDHLYLGCRFVRVPPHEGIVQAIGREVDVLSVNCYSRVPEPEAFAAWHRMSGGRPILIGEFHSPLASARQIPPPWQAFPEAEREKMVGEFVETWARQPWAVGCHWYQHADQPTTGRHTDGENQTVGMVDITDTPYVHLVRAFRRAGDLAYHWHAGEPEAR